MGGLYKSVQLSRAGKHLRTNTPNPKAGGVNNHGVTDDQFLLSLNNNDLSLFLTLEERAGNPGRVSYLDKSATLTWLFTDDK